MSIKTQTKKTWGFYFTLLFSALLFLTPSGSHSAENNTAIASPKFKIASSPKIINIVLSEWSVVPDKTSVQAGQVNFSVTNTGPGDRHEFVIFKTDLSPDELPSDSEGVDEKGIGLMLIGEIEGILIDAAPQTVSFELTPGNYVLICNIWDAKEKESHYHKGMRAQFTVTRSGAGIS